MTNADPPPHVFYYRPGEVHAIRRAYRRRVLWLIGYMVIGVVPIRLILDFFASYPQLAYIKPYILPAIVLIALVGWVSGVLVIFHRDQMRA